MSCSQMIVSIFIMMLAAGWGCTVSPVTPAWPWHRHGTHSQGLSCLIHTILYYGDQGGYFVTNEHGKIIKNSNLSSYFMFKTLLSFFPLLPIYSPLGPDQSSTLRRHRVTHDQITTVFVSLKIGKLTLCMKRGSGGHCHNVSYWWHVTFLYGADHQHASLLCHHSLSSPSDLNVMRKDGKVSAVSSDHNTLTQAGLCQMMFYSGQVSPDTHSLSLHLVAGLPLCLILPRPLSTWHWSHGPQVPRSPQAPAITTTYIMSAGEKRILYA